MKKRTESDMKKFINQAFGIKYFYKTIKSLAFRVLYACEIFRRINNRMLPIKNLAIVFCTMICLLFCTAGQAQNLNFTTHAFDADIDNVTTPKAGLASALDLSNHTHIAWIEQQNGLRSVMYSLYNGQTVTTIKVYQGADKEAPVAPSITVDNENNPHIVFFVERNTDEGINSGNYAIYYAGKQSGVFQAEQVSANPTDPNDDTENIYNCHVNGRPQITNNNGQIIITYLSGTGSYNGWDNHIISATLLNGEWSLKEEYNIDDIANVLPDDDVSLPVFSNDQFYMAFIDATESDPYVCYYENGWNSYMIQGYTGAFDNDDLHLDFLNNTSYYVSWLHTGDAKTAFIGINLNTDEVAEYSITKVPGGNFAPSTYDLTTYNFVGFYNESWTSDAYIVTTDENNAIQEIKIPNVGVVYGKRVLNARDGYISLVTASESDGKIYITTNTGPETTTLRAGFTANKHTIQTGEAVAFTDTSLGNPTVWSWTFQGGDPATSSAQNPVVTYNEPGEYGVQLIVENETDRDTLLKEALITVKDTSGTEPISYWQGPCWELLEPEINQQYDDYLKDHNFYVDANLNFYIVNTWDTLIQFQNAHTIKTRTELPVVPNSWDHYNLRDISPQGNQVYQHISVDAWADYPTSTLIIRSSEGQDLYSLAPEKELGIIESAYVGNKLHLFFYVNKTISSQVKTIDFGNNISVTTHTDTYQYYRLIFNDAHQPETLDKLFDADFAYPPTNTGNKDIRVSPEGAFVMILYSGSFIPAGGTELILNGQNKSMVVFDKTGQYQYLNTTEIDLHQYETYFFINDFNEVFFTLTNPINDIVDGITLPKVENSSSRKYLLKYNANGGQWVLSLNNYLDAEGADIIIESGYSSKVMLADDNSMYITSGGVVEDSESGEREPFSSITRIIPEGEITWVYTSGRKYARINGAAILNNHIYVPMTYRNNPTTQTSEGTLTLFSSIDLVKMGDIDVAPEANLSFMMSVDLDNECLFVPEDTSTNSIIRQINQGFKAYPNPSSGIFNVTLPAVSSNSTLQVLDLTGRVVHTQQVFNQQEVQLDLSGYYPGMYILNLSGNKQIYSLPIMKE